MEHPQVRAEWASAPDGEVLFTQASGDTRGRENSPPTRAQPQDRLTPPSEAAQPVELRGEPEHTQESQPCADAARSPASPGVSNGAPRGT